MLAYCPKCLREFDRVQYLVSELKADGSIIIACYFCGTQVKGRDLKDAIVRFTAVTDK